MACNLLLWIAALSAPLCAGAQPSADCPVLVQAAFAATGMNDTIRDMASGIQVGMSARTQLWMNAADRQRMTQAAAKAFNRETLDVDFRTEFTNSCDPEMLRTVVEQMSRPIAIRMRDLELASKTPQARRQLDRFVDDLTEKQPPSTRLLLIKRLDQASGSTALLEDSLHAAIRGFAGGSAESDVPLPKPAMDKLRNMIFVAWLFTYRDASDAELTQYVELLESPALTHFNSLFRRTFLGVMTTRSREMSRQIAPNRASRQ